MNKYISFTCLTLSILFLFHLKNELPRTFKVRGIVKCQSNTCKASIPVEMTGSKTSRKTTSTDRRGYFEFTYSGTEGDLITITANASRQNGYGDCESTKKTIKVLRSSEDSLYDRFYCKLYDCSDGLTNFNLNCGKP